MYTNRNWIQFQVKKFDQSTLMRGGRIKDIFPRLVVLCCALYVCLHTLADVGSLQNL
ncbi:hypothetical protein NA56DRAFT_176863 [Hyaloscypha hepaticicola]|uniref:Uncharacterized protein n=1 Tax=Hyaloscypha hepaticicola TaxID=2082293 RepID=A0A2J6Q1Y5_9HELO|nr:hypothetical protein NA56DRAFT_176863 [Hyaloscypha hepaticicola]